MGDEDEALAEASLEAAEVELNFGAELGVEGGHGFIEEEQVGLVDQGAGESNALFLAAGELVGVALGEGVELEHLEGFGDAAGDFRVGEFAGAEAEGDVFKDGEVREEGIALEDGVDGAAVGGEGGDVAAAEDDGAGVGDFQAGDDAEEGGFSAAGGAEEGDEFAVTDEEGDIAEDGGWAEALGEVKDVKLVGGRCPGGWGGGRAGGFNYCCTCVGRDFFQRGSPSFLLA
jgi:hypothetical protein